MATSGSVPAGTRVGRYEIVSLLRQGGMGEVYTARDGNLGRDVALKILPKNRTSDPARVERFVREARASSTLNHPSIVAVHDAGAEDGVHFLAMELIDGVPLSEWMRRRRSVASRVELMAQVADGLAKAHDAGIVHRDLKPDNIMVTTDGRAKIVDFGIAKLTERLGERTAITGISTPTSRVGTTAYMSPEQIEGKSVDRRTDVFSFGTVLYELLTGRNPFGAPQYADTIHNVTHLEPPMEPIPSELRRVVQRCLQKEAERRYDSLRDAALDLREAVAASEPKPRRKWWLAAAAVLVLLAAASWWFVRDDAASGEAVQRGMTMTRLTHSGRVTTAAISPDGRYLVHAVKEGAGEALYVKQVATGTLTRIAEPAPVYYFNLSVSADSNYAYYVGVQRAEPNIGHVYQLPLLGGEPRRIAQDTEWRYSVSPDGTRVVFIRFNVITREFRMTVAAVDGSGERVVLLRKHPDVISTPSWTPDGDDITFMQGHATRRDSTGLFRLHVPSGEVARLRTPRFRSVDAYSWLPDGSGALVGVHEQEQPTQVWFVPTDSVEARKITSDVSAYFDVSMTADSKSFVAVRGVTDSNVYVVPFGGGSDDLQPLTSGFGNWVGGNGVHWKNGAEVVFSSFANGLGTFYSVGAGGGTPRRLIENMPVWGLTVSPDGSRLAFISDKSGASEIWMADGDGGNARRLTTHGSANWPSFTADGRALVYLRQDDGQRAWRLPLDGSAPSRVTNVATNRPLVSPDGKWLLCRLRSTEPGGPLWRTAVVSLEGNAPVRYFRAPLEGGPPTLQWAAGSRSFLFVDTRDGVQNLWQQDLDGGAPRRVTSFDSGEIFAFAASPDGKRLAIARGEATRDAVLIRHFR